jgi:hypothetical protein
MKANLGTKLSKIVDFLHIFVVVPLLLLLAVYLIFGSSQSLKYLCGIFSFVLLAAQAAYLDCPLNIMSDWLRELDRPKEQRYRRSFVRTVYGKIGRWIWLRWAIVAVFTTIAGFYGKWFIESL